MTNWTKCVSLLLTTAFLGACGGDSGDGFPESAAGTVYSFATGCYSIGVVGSGSYLAANDSGDDFEVSGDSLESAARFRMRPADLATYLLFDEGERYLVSEDDAGLQRRSELDSEVSLGLNTFNEEIAVVDDSFQSEGEWDLEAGSDDEHFLLKHHRSGKYLSALGDLGAEDSAAEIRFFEQTDCATFPELSVDANLINGALDPNVFEDGSVFGFVEMHAHLFSNFAFGGGGVFHGSPFHRLGVEKALPSCAPFHGDDGTKDILNYAFGELDELDGEALLPLILGRRTPKMHSPDGYPDFTTWPDAHRDSTHQVMYYKWVERAYLSGLRFMVQHATTNHVLCEMLTGLQTQPKRYDCNDMVNVDRIIEETKGLERYIDALNGGPGEGWFRIVGTPEEAREVIGEGKMAVILGIETSVLFDCFVNPPEGTERCTESDVLAGLDEYYDKGVRALFPVHKFDNGFSSGDGDRGIFDLGSTIQTGLGSNFGLCADLDGDGLRSVADVPRNFDGGDVPFAGLNDIRDQYFVSPTFNFVGFGMDPVGVLVSGLAGENGTITEVLEILGAPPLVGDYCQRIGLSSLGEFLIEEMMKRGMILEVDHLPRLSRKRAFEMMEANDYPAVGTHGNNHNGEIYAFGGLSKMNLGRCRSATETSTMDNSLQARAQQMRDSGGFEAGFGAEGFGFDLNGFAGAPRPRFGENANCGDEQTDPVTYPFTSYAGDVEFTAPVVGDRSLDFNTLGMAHLGLVAELIEDVRGDGVTDEELEPLFKSAEAYIRMWEKSERRGEALSSAP